MPPHGAVARALGPDLGKLKGDFAVTQGLKVARCQISGASVSPPPGQPLHACLRVCVLGCCSHVRLCVTLCSIDHQAPSWSMEFSRQDY